jgi:peptide/nickel transport system ATP-binding protein
VGRLAVQSRPAALKRKLQMVFQNPDSTLNPSHTVGYAIGRAVRRLRRLGAAEARREVARLLEVVKLSAEFTDRKPHQLSGGQKQRVAIARALVNRPSILLADEPTGNLDSATSYDIMELFRTLYREGQTIIVVTHEPDIAEYALRQIHLKDGRIESDFATPKTPG